MSDFPESAWNTRLRHPSRAGAVLEVVPGEDAGCIYVAGRFFTSETAAQVLALETLPEPDFVDVTGGGIADLGMREYEYRGPRTDLPRLVAELRTQARSSARELDDPTLRAEDCEVALHYVLSGSAIFIPKGHPFDAPHRLVDVASPRRWPPGGPTVAVVDTGLDPETRTGQGARVDPAAPTGVDGAVLVLDVDRDRDLLTVPTQAGDELAAQAGHGTFITSLIGRQSGGTARVVDVRALDADGVGTEEELVAALDRLVSVYPDIPVVNLSLGGYTDGNSYADIAGAQDGNAPDSMPLALGRWLHRFHARNRESVVVAAAGNYGQERPFWPAADPRVVAVASLSTELTRSAFSNFGPWVDVATFGEKVAGDFPHGAVVDEAGGSVLFKGQAASWSGTSFATPVLAAEIARRIAEAAAAGRALPAVSAWQELASTLSADAAQPGLGLIWDPRVLGAAFDPHDP